MDKSLSQEEIDALFNQSSDSLIKATDNDNTKKDEKIESLLDYKYNENAKMIQDLFEANKKNETVQNDELINYQNSPFYASYMATVNNIESILTPLIHQLNAEYMFMAGINFDNESNLKRMSKEILLPNMVIAQVVYEDFKQLIYDTWNRLREEAGITEIVYDVDVKKADYIPMSTNKNLVKKVDGYKIIIKVNTKGKIK